MYNLYLGESILCSKFFKRTSFVPNKKKKNLFINPYCTILREKCVFQLKKIINFGYKNYYFLLLSFFSYFFFLTFFYFHLFKPFSTKNSNVRYKSNGCNLYISLKSAMSISKDQHIFCYGKTPYLSIPDDNCN